MSFFGLSVFVFVTGFICHASGDCPPRNKVTVTQWLLKNSKKCKVSHAEYPSFDGSYHNMDKTEQGSFEQVFKGWSGVKANASKTEDWIRVWGKIIPFVSMCRNSTDAADIFFGKQVANEIFNVGNSPCAERYSLNRHHSERNYATPYIDGGVIYGSSRHLLNKYISPQNGSIITESTFFRNVDVTSALKMLWIKWHNALADELQKACPNWSGEKIFNEARKFTIAVQQRVYVYEWLPKWIGKNLTAYRRYDPFVNPQVVRLFQAAMHLVQYVPERYCDDIWCQQLKDKNSTGDFNEFVAHVMMYLHNNTCRTLENKRFVKIPEQYLKLPDINHARKAFNLTQYSGWAKFLATNKMNVPLLNSYLEKYETRELDSMLGGMIESRDGPGKLFVEVIQDQFRRIRNGDRFWFENTQNNLFSEDEICIINSISISDVLETVLGNVDHRKLAAFHINLIVDEGKTQISSSKFVRYGIVLFSTVLIYCFVIAVCLIAGKQSVIKTKTVRHNQAIKDSIKDKLQNPYPTFLVQGYGIKGPKQRLLLVLDEHLKQITVLSTTGTTLRAILCQNSSQAKLRILTINNEAVAIVKSATNYDLALKFESKSSLTNFINELDLFVMKTIKEQIPTITNVKSKLAKAELVTKEHHQILLEKFFRVAFAQAFNIEHSMEEILGVDASVAIEVVYTKLTLVEFAECLRMCSQNEFASNMFSLVDRDQRGFICFREFLDVIILFANGKCEDKAHLFFKLYDIDGTAVLPAQDFRAMLNSFLNIMGERSTPDHVQNLLHRCSIDKKQKLDFRDFKKVMGQELQNLSRTILDSNKSTQKGRSYLSMVRQTIQTMYGRDKKESTTYNISVMDKEQENVLKPSERNTNLQNILFSCQPYYKFALITLLILYVFIDKIFYFYSITKLNGINRYMLATSTGATYGIALTYSLLLLTMCRNIFILTENTLLNRYLTFYTLKELNCYAGAMSAIFILIHVVGKVYLFIRFVDFLPKTMCEVEFVDEEIEYIVQLNWKNPVMISGLLLLTSIIPIYVSAQPCVRRHLYNVFYFTHYLHPFVIVLIVIHGALSQSRLLFSILSGPLAVFVLDYFIRKTRKTVNLPVLRTELLPSNVICLNLKRPDNFQYDVGQWVSLTVDQIHPKMFHRFTLSSVASEPNLRIHILPAHPVAHQLYPLTELPNAQIRVSIHGGAHGISVQPWRFHNATILIGGGTGVAFFASVLKDAVHVLRTKTDVPCKKVYFIWISKRQKYCEWMTDLIREVEDCDDKNLFSGHVFITEFYEKFDLRTIMLMVFEKHYNRVFGRSIFTSLKSVVHFGRPDLLQLFQTVQSLHQKARTVGVFTSGPVSLRSAVSVFCTQINLQGHQRFEHLCADHY